MKSIYLIIKIRCNSPDTKIWNKLGLDFRQEQFLVMKNLEFANPKGFEIFG